MPTGSNPVGPTMKNLAPFRRSFFMCARSAELCTQHSDNTGAEGNRTTEN